MNNSRRGAAAALEQSHAYAQAVQTGLVATIAESYYTLLMLDEQLTISEQALANWDETITTLESACRSGKSKRCSHSSGTRQPNGTQRLTADHPQEHPRNGKQPVCLAQRIFAYYQPRHTRRAVFSDELSIGIPLQLLANRPDVQQAEFALAEAFYATNAARTSFYPSLTLSGTPRLDEQWRGTILNPGKWLSNAIAQLVTPLFNKGTNIANLKIAKARQQEAVLRFEQSLLNAGNEVNDALTEWQTADGRIRLDYQQTADLEAATEKHGY